MKTAAKTIIFALISTAMGFAQAPKQLGAWSVYQASSHSSNVIMLQSTSDGLYNDAQGNPVRAKLDVICKNGKLNAVALEPNVVIRKDSLSYTGPVATTRVSVSIAGQTNQAENWAVLDNGRTLSPYSEILQGKLMRQWVARIAGTDKMAFQLDANESLSEPSFATSELSQALAAVGCH